MEELRDPQEKNQDTYSLTAEGGKLLAGDEEASMESSGSRGAEEVQTEVEGARREAGLGSHGRGVLAMSPTELHTSIGQNGDSSPLKSNGLEKDIRELGEKWQVE